MSALQRHTCPKCTYAWNTVGPEGSAVHLSLCPRCHPSREIVSAATDLAESLVYMVACVEQRMASGRIAHDVDLLLVLRRAHEALDRAGIRP